MFHFRGLKEFFQIIHDCQLCLLIVSHNCAKFQKHSRSGFQEKDVQGFGPYSG